MRRLSYIAGIAALIVFVQPAAGQQRALEEFLLRMGQYLVDYEARLSTVVAEEHYDQWIQTPPALRRKLTSDFLLMRLPEGFGWLGVRDVFLVDGKPVRDRDQRLLTLLSQGSADAREQVAKIAAENARYNIGDVFRNTNVPTLTLDLLHPRNRSRVSLRKTGEATIEGTRTWKIDFTEHSRPSLIRSLNGQDRLARGTAWVEPVEGAVVRTQLDLGGDDAFELLRSRVTVNYRRDATLDLRVPSEMREIYQRPTRQIGGLATYRNFRRFETSVRILPPP